MAMAAGGRNYNTREFEVGTNRKAPKWDFKLFDMVLWECLGAGGMQDQGLI